ncbi:DUF5133 domain-containing protein [Streptomyces sp. NPDC056683]|uniref:DUF5133 domain-containing protein n=1 Tax=Streptomyces sp. NPDC056683 TaxID=3345910 RepID=UPI0036C41733
MITPRPQMLRGLLARHAEACVRVLEADTAASRHVLRDIAYTLCVVTGTSEIKDALAAADRLLAARPHETSRERPPQTLVA